jgi:RNA polymerase sigma-70 factor (sigma-E family)
MGRQRADPTADREFETFFVSHRALYWRIAFAIVGNPSMADDVTQETFGAIYARWQRIQATQVEAYCRTMLVNASLTAVRKRKREALVEAPELLPRAAAPQTVDPARGRDTRIDLMAMLRGLSPGFRAVVALRYLEDLPVVEVASILGISEGTVKSQSSRALALLREQLDASAEDPLPTA